jgi:hypothetical protein
MSIKLLYLKSGEQVISDVKELIRKDSDKVYGYVLTQPHEVVASKAVVLTEDASDDRNVEVTLSPWILLTEDKSMTVPQDWIITIVNPIGSILKMYEEKTNG